MQGLANVSQNDYHEATGSENLHKSIKRLLSTEEDRRAVEKQAWRQQRGKCSKQRDIHGLVSEQGHQSRSKESSVVHNS
jgi:hypothetical protein